MARYIGFDYGAVGVDLNLREQAWAVMGSLGIPLSTGTIRTPDFCSHGKEREIEKVVNTLIDIAISNWVGIVMEALDLKDAHLKGEDLKTFAFESVRLFEDALRDKTRKFKIGLLRVYPAHTSKIGRLYFMGLSPVRTKHEAAACAIAAKGMNVYHKGLMSV